MEILYKCGYCEHVYNSEEEVRGCEARHESWRNATVEFDEDNLSPSCYGSPDEIRLRNEEGTTFVYKRVTDPHCY